MFGVTNFFDTRKLGKPGETRDSAYYRTAYSRR